MATYSKCPSCNNKTDGDTVYKCRQCGKTFCKRCGDDSKFGDVCPKCDVACQPAGEIH